MGGPLRPDMQPWSLGGGFFFFFGDKISDYFLLKSKEALENAPKTESSNSKPGPWSEIEKVKNTKKDKKEMLIMILPQSERK